MLEQVCLGCGSSDWKGPLSDGIRYCSPCDCWQEVLFVDPEEPRGALMQIDHLLEQICEDLDEGLEHDAKMRAIGVQVLVNAVKEYIGGKNGRGTVLRKDQV